ncbi:hypothetical protein [Laceyella putida]|uniref:Uncharacterized protein n=1 Tax=Laceyella putida TaxID=110101 RepID=A0ABW2RMW3_9BACL
MKEEKHPTWKQITIGTLAGINLMFLALIAGKESIAIEEAVPSLAKTPKGPSERIEYGMELVETTTASAQDLPSTAGRWIVEHYLQYEYHYDQNGRLLFKSPTKEHSYLRYFQPQGKATSTPS